MIRRTAKDSVELCGPTEKDALGRVSTEKIGTLAVYNQIDGWWVRGRKKAVNHRASEDFLYRQI